MKRSRLRIAGKSDTAEIKREIQFTLREIVIMRDKGCILRFKRHCGGEIGKAVIQADHLVTRANSATYADPRLVVALCKGCHGGWKQWNKEAYDALVKTILPPDRVALWERCERERYSTVTRKGSYDWKLELIVLKGQLVTMKAQLS